MTPQGDRTRGAGRTATRPSFLPAFLLIAGLALVAIVAGWVGWSWVGDRADLDLGVLGPLALLGLVGVLLRERALGPHLGISVNTVVLAAAIPLAGPHGAALVGLVSHLGDYRQRHWRPYVFNTAMAAAVGGLGGLAYVALGGVVGQLEGLQPFELLQRVALPLFVAYAALTVTNVLAVATMSSIVRGTRVLDFALRALRGVGWGYLSHVVIGFLFVVLWGPVRLNAVAALFVLGPLFTAHWTIGREALARREHQETVATFVAALEQSDPTTAGHSSRVAALAEALGRELGVRGRAAEELHYAALLHDIGLVVSRTSQAPQEADEASYLTRLSAHPEAGVKILRGLDFLSRATSAIAAHHERYDGRGYPAGLTGEQIPRAARIIAVADAYDALTVPLEGEPLTRSQALQELQARAGTHLDPEVVSALRALLNRPRGLPVPEVPRSVTAPVVSGTAVMSTAPDHDHPRMSDAFAQWQPEGSVRAG